MRTIAVLSEVLVQAAFVGPCVFLLLYTLWHNWWKTLFGRALAGLNFAIIGALLRPVLFEWGIISFRNPEQNPDFWEWLSVCSIALVPVTTLTLTWLLIRPRWQNWWKDRRYREPRHSPLTEDAGLGRRTPREAGRTPGETGDSRA